MTRTTKTIKPSTLPTPESMDKALFITTINSKGREIIETVKHISKHKTVQRIPLASIGTKYFGTSTPISDKVKLADAKEVYASEGQDTIIRVEAITEGGHSANVKGYQLLNGCDMFQAAKASGAKEVNVQIAWSHKLDDCGNPTVREEYAIRDMQRVGANALTLTEAITKWMIKLAGLTTVAFEAAVGQLQTLNHKNPNLAPSAIRALKEGFARVGTRSISSFVKNNLKLNHLPKAEKTAIKKGTKSVRETTRKAAPVIAEGFKAICKAVRSAGKAVGSGVDAAIQAQLDLIARETKKLNDLVAAQRKAQQGFSTATA